MVDSGLGPSARRRQVRWLAVAITLVAVGTVGAAWADVVLMFQTGERAGSVGSPFVFANGGNYASANAEGLTTNTYPNAQSVSVTAAINGAAGAYGTYLLDTLEIVGNITTGATWHLHLDVTTALVGTGINAAFVSYCTSAPTGVPDTGVTLASGTDANGNPWAIFGPTCAGTHFAHSLLAVGPGGAVTIVGLTSGTTVVYVSFLLAVTNTGATTTTAAALTLVASSP
ncbi:MAG: hypothetical protein L3K15_01855 [Thermoplasmata archaeon]|nr:hypothetical protein [Thermoplasmata archaeon]